jgi:hypothetical protein
MDTQGALKQIVKQQPKVNFMSVKIFADENSSVCSSALEYLMLLSQNRLVTHTFIR